MVRILFPVILTVIVNEDTVTPIDRARLGDKLNRIIRNSTSAKALANGLFWAGESEVCNVELNLLLGNLEPQEESRSA